MGGAEIWGMKVLVSWCMESIIVNYRIVIKSTWNKSASNWSRLRVPVKSSKSMLIRIRTSFLGQPQGTGVCVRFRLIAVYYNSRVWVMYWVPRFLCDWGAACGS